MASKHLATTQQNFTRLVIVCVDLIKLVLKDILSIKISPADLYNAIASCSDLTSGREKLRQEQNRICFITAPAVPDYDKFDVTLLYKLIRYLCSSLKPTRGWGKSPAHTDIQIGDDIERLRIFRNEVYGHCNSSHVDDTEFVSRWVEVKTAIKRIEAMLCSKGSPVDYDKNLEKINNLEIGPEEMERFKLLLETMMFISKKEENRGDPEIWIKGENKVTCGGEACFRVDVESPSVHTSWSFTWQRIKGKTTEEIDTTVKKYKGSNDRQLVIQNVSKEDEGEYQAVLSRQNRKVISNALYLVTTGSTYKPDLYILNVSIEVEGIALNYDFRITNNSPNVHDVAWTKNGNSVDISHSKYTGGGIDDRTLTITSPTTEDAGLYTCTVTNAVGAVSKSLTLDIPRATISFETPVSVGSTIKITSKVTACPPPEKATWQKSSDSVMFEDINMDSPKHAESERNPHNPILVIAKASSDDKLYYRLLVWNKIGECLSNTVYLNVTDTPLWMKAKIMFKRVWTQNSGSLRPTPEYVSAEGTVLSESDMSKFTMVMGKDYELIARYLQLSQNEIDIIEMENKSMKIVMHKIFLIWRSKLGHSATLEMLEKSLQDAESESGARLDWEVFIRAKKGILKSRGLKSKTNESRL